MLLIKFGGSSVGSVENLQRVMQIVKKQTEPFIMVVSAFSGVTNTLQSLGENALKNTYNLNDLVPIALYDVKDDIWFARFKFTATPQFVLINKEGQIKDIIYGGAEGVTMETILKKMATKFSLPTFELK